MDRRLLYARMSKVIYRLTYSTGLVRSPFMRRFENRARKGKQRVIQPGDALVCLPNNKVVPIDQTVQSQELVLPTRVVEHFIDKSGYRALMNFCICRDSNRCKDYPRELGCLFLGETARQIHPDLCRPVSKEEAKDHIRKCQEAGLIHIVGKAAVDCLWLDIGPHTHLFTICSCCPCCCISLATQYMPPDFTDWFHKMPGVEVRVTEECLGCGVCVEQCIYNGISLENGRAVITGQCRACGRCVAVCPQEAIHLSIEDRDFVQQTIDFLEPRAVIQE